MPKIRKESLKDGSAGKPRRKKRAAAAPSDASEREVSPSDKEAELSDDRERETRKKAAKSAVSAMDTKGIKAKKKEKIVKTKKRKVAEPSSPSRSPSRSRSRRKSKRRRKKSRSSSRGDRDRRRHNNKAASQQHIGMQPWMLQQQMMQQQMMQQQMAFGMQNPGMMHFQMMQQLMARQQRVVGSISQPVPDDAKADAKAAGDEEEVAPPPTEDAKEVAPSPIEDAKKAVPTEKECLENVPDVLLKDSTDIEEVVQADVSKVDEPASLAQGEDEGDSKPDGAAAQHNNNGDLKVKEVPAALDAPVADAEPTKRKRGASRWGPGPEQVETDPLPKKVDGPESLAKLLPLGAAAPAPPPPPPPPPPPVIAQQSNTGLPAPEKLSGEDWEEPRSKTDLKLFGEIAPQDRPWTYLLNDVSRRSYVGFLLGAVSKDMCSAYFEKVRDGVIWQRPVSSIGPIPRLTAWMVSGGCTCLYRYGGVEVKAQQFPPWMLSLMEQVMPICGLSQPSEWPNACNANLYMDGSMSVGWHSDDEELFQGSSRDCRIISLSLGATRRFELRLNWPGPGDRQSHAWVSLGDGDLCTMEGMTQKHLQHRVPREDHIRGPRINLTWRWVVKHMPQCCLLPPPVSAAFSKAPPPIPATSKEQANMVQSPPSEQHCLPMAAADDLAESSVKEQANTVQSEPGEQHRLTESAADLAESAIPAKEPASTLQSQPSDQHHLPAGAADDLAPSEQQTLPVGAADSVEVEMLEGDIDELPAVGDDGSTTKSSSSSSAEPKGNLADDVVQDDLD